MNGLKTPHSLAWNTLHNEPLATQLAMFRQASAQINAQDVKSGFRAFATDLLARGLIDMSDYVAIFGGKALDYLPQNWMTPLLHGQGCFARPKRRERVLL